MQLVIVTVFTLMAFAGNSLLCRAALGGHLIDPVSFTTFRLVSGALALIPISRLLGRGERSNNTKGSWGSGFALFAYAIALSLAYISLGAAMGALILFGAVQVTMIGAALKSGERLRPMQWTGTAIAIAGLVYLVLPGISAPNPLSASLMFLSGLFWGIYSIRGRKAASPVSMTAGNFLRAAPMTLVVSGFAYRSAHIEQSGVVLALISGMVTSALGYILWYKALRKLTTAQASIVQLTVPVLAGIGGVLFLSETLSPRLAIAGALILGGVALAVLRRTPIGPDCPSTEESVYT